MDLSHGLQFTKLSEGECNRLLNAMIGVFLDAIVRGLEIADCHRQEQLATPCLLLEGFERALAKQ